MGAERKIVNDRLIDQVAFGIQFSPDGTMIAYGKNGNLTIMDVKSGTTRELLDSNKRRYASIEHNFGWSPDSERICFRGLRLENQNEAEIAIVTVKGTDPKHRVRFDSSEYGRDITWHPDGKKIMITHQPPGGRRTQLHEFDADADGPSVRYANQVIHRGNSCPFWSFDGKLLLYIAQLH